MTPLAALALAVRDRLTAGAEAPLPGIGTLACAHISARVRTAPDGRRVMLPPGEAVGLLARPGDPTDLAQALARHAGAAPTAAAGALRDAVDQIDARLAITGDARLDGIGMFQRTSSGVRFAAAPELLAAVNRPYEGLVPVPLAPAATPEPVAAPPRPAPPEPTVPDSPPGAVDILLDLIVNEPSETTAAPATPAQSAFADDDPEPDVADPLAPTEAAGAVPPTAVPDADDVQDTSDVPDDVPAEIAVPFGDAPLRDRLPPTPDARDGWQPAPRADVDRGARPLDRLTIEDAEQVEDAELVEDEPASDERAGLAPDLDLAAADAAVAEKAAPRTPEPTASALLDDIYPGDAPPRDASPAARSTRRGWALLYAATVLALSALVLYWAVAERRPPVVSQTAAPAAPARRAAPAAASLAADSLAADSLVASPDSLVPATGRP